MSFPPAKALACNHRSWRSPAIYNRKLAIPKQILLLSYQLPIYKSCSTNKVWRNVVLRESDVLSNGTAWM